MPLSLSRQSRTGFGHPKNDLEWCRDKVREWMTRPSLLQLKGSCGWLTTCGGFFSLSLYPCSLWGKVYLSENQWVVFLVCAQNILCHFVFWHMRDNLPMHRDFPNWRWIKALQFCGRLEISLAKTKKNVPNCLPIKVQIPRKKKKKTNKPNGVQRIWCGLGSKGQNDQNIVGVHLGLCLAGNLHASAIPAKLLNKTIWLGTKKVYMCLGCLSYVGTKLWPGVGCVKNPLWVSREATFVNGLGGVCACPQEKWKFSSRPLGWAKNCKEFHW